MNHLQITGVANARKENNTAAPTASGREIERWKVYIESTAGSRKLLALSLTRTHTHTHTHIRKTYTV